MNAKTLEAVTRHGNSLLAVFTECTEKDPVALCKKLRRIENAASRNAVQYCNGEISDEVFQKAKAGIKKRLSVLLGNLNHVYLNGDPRGYALKLDDEWTREYNRSLYGDFGNHLTIYTDMGGYGILAPDLTTK